jgi:hypothetical protein
MHGFSKRTTIGGGIRYSIEFRLKQLQELGALASPLYTRLSSSDIHPSIGAASSSTCWTQANKTRAGAPSQKKRARFMQEDARLVVLKETKRWSCGEIEGAFLVRTRTTLQVHYSIKLRDQSTPL